MKKEVLCIKIEECGLISLANHSDVKNQGMTDAERLDLVRSLWSPGVFEDEREKGHGFDYLVRLLPAPLVLQSPISEEVGRAGGCGRHPS